MIQEWRAVEDEPAEKVMVELRRRHYPDPWGRPSQGELEALESIAHRGRSPAFRAALSARRGRSSAWPASFPGTGSRRWSGNSSATGRAATEPRSRESATPRKYAHCAFESHQTQIGIAYPSVPYRHPDYFQAWGAVGVLSGGISARLFTEVRERRGLCYSVYATYHTLRDRGAVFCYAGTSADRAQETLDVTLGELVRLKQGIEPHELDRLKARIKSAWSCSRSRAPGGAPRSPAIGITWAAPGRWTRSAGWWTG